MSPSPFIHRVVSKANATTAASASPRPKNTENVPQPQYPDLTQNLNSFSKYNADSGYHGMENDNDDMALPDTQPDTQTSTQPLEANEPMAQSSQGDISMSQQTADDSFHSAQENVRARGETVEPMNIDPTPTQERTPRPAEQTHEEPQSNSTPKAKTEAKANASPKKQQEPENQHGPEQQDDELASPSKSSPKKQPLSQPSKTQEPEKQDVDMEDAVKEDTVLDTFDDIGSPSDGSTPERPLVRKSSLTFASLPAREPLTKSRISRTSHIDLPKLNNPSRPSYLGRQTGSQKPNQPVEDDNGDEANAMDVDDKGPAEDSHMDQASKLHNTKSTQSLHERISMLGKLQPSRPKKSIAAAAGSSAGQVAYPDLPSAKPETKTDSSGQKTHGTPAPEPEPTSNDDDDWIKPLSSPNRPTLSKSKTTDVMEKLFDTERDQSAANKDTPATQEQQSVEPERPKTSTSIFSSPRPKGHQQTASASNITGEASTTPTGSPRRYDGPLSASKMRLHSIMKSAKGLLTSSGSSARKEPSSPTQQPTQSQERASIDIDDKEEQESQPQQIPSPPRQEIRRTRSSTEKEEKQRQREQEDRQQKEARQEEARQEKAREQEKQRALQLKAAQEKSSVEPEDRAGPAAVKQPQHQRQQSREPESIHEASKSAAQPKQNDRRPKPPTRELQKPRPQPVSIRVGSTLPRQMPMASSVSSNVQETNVSAPPQPTAPAPKASSLKKKGSNQSLQTASSTSSFKSSVSTQQTQAQRKAQLASEKKKEQEERENRRKEEQKREQERKRAAQQQQDEARRQEMRSRAEAADRERRERSAQEDPKKAAHMQAIEKRRLENARRHERQGSQQATNEVRRHCSRNLHSILWY